MASSIEVRLAGFGGDGTVRVVSTGDLPPPAGDPQAASPPAKTSTLAINTASPTDGARVDAALRSGGFWIVVGAFFVAGVLLSFTPCVLPMLPILSSIIVGDGAATTGRGRAMALAGSYSLGMAVVYTALGIAAGLVGEGLAAWLQTPWVLGLFAIALVGLSLSMFGFYELRLPSGVTGALSQSSRRLRGGRVAGVFAMGGMSALIVSPCVAAPLAGALVYLSQTRDVALGGSALFSLAAGMSVPLLLLGASAGALLPKAGAWMEDVKRLFGLLLLAVAIWIVQPVLPASLALALWGALLIGVAVWLGLLVKAAPAWRRAIGLVAALAGALQLVGAASGGTDPLQPLSHFGSRAQSSGHLRFEIVRSIGELDAALARAGRPAMLDFYADWCVSCKEMERFTFSDLQVRAKLDGALLLKADVTKNTVDDRALMRRFGLFGPPGTLFFDASGRERPDLRVIGYQDRERFLQTLQAAGL
jgi:thioredoxin:protein disulfide reductase